MATILQQIHRNAVALISLFIAISSLAYNTWRNETTEDHRNIRYAAFRVLEDLGELQQVVDYRYYYLPFDGHAGREGELRIRGFGNVGMVHDLMLLMPDPAPAVGRQLNEQWLANFDDLDELDSDGRHTEAASASEQNLTAVIGQAREAVLGVLSGLD